MSKGTDFPKRGTRLKNRRAAYLSLFAIVLVLAVGCFSTGEESRLFALDAGSGRVQWSVGLSGDFQSPTFAEGLVAVVTGQGFPKGGEVKLGVRVFDARTGKGRWTFTPSFSPDGGTLAVALDDDTLHLFSAEDGEPLQTLPKPVSDQFVFSPDGHFLLYWDQNDELLQRWEIARAEKTFELSIPSGCVGACERPPGFMDISPDGRLLAVLPGNGILGLWDALSGKPLFTRALFGFHDDSVMFSPDGKMLVVWSYDGAVIWLGVP